MEPLGEVQDAALNAAFPACLGLARHERQDLGLGAWVGRTSVLLPRGSMSLPKGSNVVPFWVVYCADGDPFRTNGHKNWGHKPYPVVIPIW